ncbi:CPBP family intramembrane metalloprotease [Clostridium botulinum]|nr:CPBP family intramembrane metalloprotease [Clostridium botulinum]
MEDNTKFKRENTEEIGKITNIIVNLFMYQVVFSVVFTILLNILEYIGIKSNVIEPYGKLIAETMGYIFFIKSYIKDTKQKLKFENTVSFKGYIFISLLLLSYILIYDNTMEIILSKIIKNSWFYDSMAKKMKNPITICIETVIMAPIFEEIVYRGIILDELLQKYNHKKAIIISALIFSIIHLNFSQGINALLLGIILASIYYGTKSLIPVIIIHFLNNLFYIIKAFYVDIHITEFDVTKFGVGLIIIIILVCILGKNNKKTISY